MEVFTGPRKMKDLVATGTENTAGVKRTS